MSLRMVQTEWPGGFKSGEAVIHKGRMGHVVSIPSGIIPADRVPVLYDDESGCFVDIPVDELHRRFRSSPLNSERR